MTCRVPGLACSLLLFREVMLGGGGPLGGESLRPFCCFFAPVSNPNQIDQANPFLSLVSPGRRNDAGRIALSTEHRTLSHSLFRFLFLFFQPSSSPFPRAEVGFKFPISFRLKPPSFRHCRYSRPKQPATDPARPSVGPLAHANTSPSVCIGCVYRPKG